MLTIKLVCSFFFYKLILRDAANWANPIVRQFFKRGSRLYAVFGIAYLWIIYVTTNRAFPLFQLIHHFKNRIIIPAYLSATIKAVKDI